MFLSSTVLINFFPSGDDDDSSVVHLGRMLQILREFSTDQILSTYVIDDVWEYMDAMKVYICFSLNVGACCLEREKFRSQFLTRLISNDWVRLCKFFYLT